MKLPATYREVRCTGAVAFAVEGAADWVADVLSGGETLHGWASARAGGHRFQGRAAVPVVNAAAPGPDRAPRWAVRHYVRGGAVAPLLGDRYARVGTPRPHRELAASVAARERGVRTPAIVAGAAYRKGAIYRADLVTEVVEGSVNLAEVLFGPGTDIEGTTALRASAALVRQLERHGVLHLDLNAKNVLLSMGGGRLRAFVLDLDRSRIRPPGARARSGFMRRRLERSLAKHATRSGRPLQAADWAALRSGYGRTR